MTLITSWPAFVSLVPVFGVLEASTVIPAVAKTGGWDLLGAVVVLSVAASAYTLCHVALIQVKEKEAA